HSRRVARCPRPAPAYLSLRRPSLSGSWPLAWSGCARKGPALHPRPSQAAAHSHSTHAEVQAVRRGVHSIWTAPSEPHLVGRGGMAAQGACAAVRGGSGVAMVCPCVLCGALHSVACRRRRLLRAEAAPTVWLRARAWAMLLQCLPGGGRQLGPAAA